MSDDDSRLDREAILARRRRFVAATLTGLTTSTLATACPCLKVAPEPTTEPEPDSSESDEDMAEPDVPEDPTASEAEAPPAEPSPAEASPAGEPPSPADG